MQMTLHVLFEISVNIIDKFIPNNRTVCSTLSNIKFCITVKSNEFSTEELCDKRRQTTEDRRHSITNAKQQQCNCHVPLKRDRKQSGAYLWHTVQTFVQTQTHCTGAELSMGWVDPRVGSGRVGSRFYSFCGLSWVVSTVPKAPIL